MQDSLNDQPDPKLSRRRFGHQAIAYGTVVAGASQAAVTAQAAAVTTAASVSQVPAAKPVDAKTGRLNQSLCKWCYDKNLSLEELCGHAKRMGLVGIDLLGPKDFETLKKHGLVCTMVTSHKLTDGLCDPKYWDEALETLNGAIEATSAAGFRNVICFSGNARGMDRKTGLKNCAESLRKITPVAEKKQVIHHMELLKCLHDQRADTFALISREIELCKESTRR